jgi:glycosyltransferase involved in cell wall biosynthesis
LQENARTLIAVLWSRFGPYHLARLKGAAEKSSDIAEIVGIEVAEADLDYAWEFAEGAGRYERRTLFPQRNYHGLSSQSIRTAVSNTLEILNPDVVAVNGWSVTEARAALLWARRNGRRAVLMSETKEDDLERVWWKERLKRHFVQKFDAALVGGAKQMEYLVALGMPSERIFVGYDVVDNAYFRRGAVKARREKSQLRRTLALPIEYFFVCTRFLARKNLDGLLVAYADYSAKTQRPWALVIAGSGPDEARLRQMEKDLELRAVKWLGFVQYGQLPAYYGLASAFVHPAKSEPWGLVLNEAAASGLPLVVSDTVGARHELVQPNRNGITFDPHSPSSISQALSNISRRSPAERRAMGSNSSTIVAVWGPDLFGRQLLAAANVSRQIGDGLSRTGGKNNQSDSCP